MRMCCATHRDCVEADVERTAALRQHNARDCAHQWLQKELRPQPIQEAKRVLPEDGELLDVAVHGDLTKCCILDFARHLHPDHVRAQDQRHPVLPMIAIDIRHGIDRRVSERTCKLTK